ncbi:hypothetical protein [Deinococcus aestuarii]|uniref:hypothetical protein n=1 Tax=Deinococcus aestuarii TaxID=2774531 RepID=UPI001C0D5C89|nr:hypothetical protein [Deinococcus aestuarii]
MVQKSTVAPPQHEPPPSAGVRSAVVAAVAHTYACPESEVEQEMTRHGDFTVKSVPAHAVLARLAADLGVKVPNPSKLHRAQYSSVNALVELVLSAQRRS